MSDHYTYYYGECEKARVVKFSHATPDLDVWEHRSYYFPYAERIAKHRGGWLVLKGYIMVRMFLEKLWKK